MSCIALFACSVEKRELGAGAQGGSGGGGASGSGNQGGSSAGMGAGSGGSAGQGGNGGSGGAGSPDAGGADAGPGLLPLPMCADVYMLEPAVAQASTESTGGSRTLSCGSGASDDVAFFWVPESSGYYTIDTFGSSFDTALGVLAADCSGTELACADDSSGGTQSEIVGEFTAGEGVLLVVDGKSGSFGDVVLNVSPVTCPAIDLNAQPLPLNASTLSGANAHGGACGGDGFPEVAYRYRAPSAGLYRFSVSVDSTQLEPALYVEQGPRCGGELLGCNSGNSFTPATVVRRLAADEVVTLIVDGGAGSGPFTLNVEDLTPTTCPANGPLDTENVIDDDYDTSGTLLPDDPSILTGSCTPYQQVMQPGGTYVLSEHSYSLHMDGGSGVLGIVTDGSVAVYVLEGLQCGGREIVCQHFEGSPDFQDVEVDLGDLFDGLVYDYTIVVEATAPSVGPVNYTLYFTPILI